MSNTPIKRKLEQIIDLNDGFCQTPPSAKKARKTYTLEYKLKMIEASKNYPSQRAFAASHNLDEALIRLWFFSSLKNEKNNNSIRTRLVFAFD